MEPPREKTNHSPFKLMSEPRAELLWLTRTSGEPDLKVQMELYSVRVTLKPKPIEAPKRVTQV